MVLTPARTASILSHYRLVRLGRFMLRRVLGSWLLAGVVAVLAAGNAIAASVLLATIPPPSPGAPAVNDTLNGLNATGSNLITGVSLIAKFEVSGTALVPATGTTS